MRIYEFIDKYCQDIVERQKKVASLIDLSEFPHDGIVEDEYGDSIPVVYVDGSTIPVSDFLTLDREDFLLAHNTQSCVEAFDNYVSALTILEGEEALNRIRSMILSETERLKEDVQLTTSI